MSTVANGKYNLVGTSGKSQIRFKGRRINILTVTEEEAAQLVKEGFQYLKAVDTPSNEAKAEVNTSTGGGEAQKLKSLTKDQLILAAADAGIEGVENLKKDEIIEKILSSEANKA